MDKEKSSAETAKVFPKVPKMSVIKGTQTEYVSIPAHSLYAELKKFAQLKEKSPLLFKLPLDNVYKRSIKRGVDLIFSMVVILSILSWLLPIVALLIKLYSKGPVFSLQKRNKRNGKVFTCIKFRSMIESDDTDILQTLSDERITKLNGFLRNSYIDELPQFFNVLMGDMSFIGPRPQLVNDNNKYEELIEFYDFRHKVKPGITGLSQVMGHTGETKHIQAMRDLVQLDIFYIRHWSLWLDVKIIWCALRKLTVI